MFGGGDHDLDLAVSQAKLRAAGSSVGDESSTWRTRVLSAVLLIVAVAAVGLAWRAGGATAGIAAAVASLAVLAGFSIAMASHTGRGPGGPLI